MIFGIELLAGIGLGLSPVIYFLMRGRKNDAFTIVSDGTIVEEQPAQLEVSEEKEEELPIAVDNDYSEIEETFIKKICF